MAHHDMNTMMSTPEMIWELVSKPFRRFIAGLEGFMENNALAQARMEAARKVAEMSDADLDKLGMSRTYAFQIALGRFD